MTTASSSLRRIALVVLDMAGTTVADVGLTEIAYTSALRAVDVESRSPALREMLDYARRTMGEPVISVLRRLFNGDEARAQTALKSFDERYAEFADAGQIVAMPGAAYAMQTLRTSGIRVALSSGLPACTHACLVDALAWHKAADAVIRADNPDANPVLEAAQTVGVDEPELIATVGDTAFDIDRGRRAGASLVAGVLTGAHTAERLCSAGATHLLPAAMSLPEFITPA
jgi:phosphonatase-like hydrolase